MSLGSASLALTLLMLGQTAEPTPVRGDKELQIPTAFAKKVPESVGDLKAIEAHVRDLTKKCMPATVGIRIGQSSGSGVIIDAEGHVLTAGHVSGDPNRDCQIIMPDGNIFKGKTLGANRGIDSGMIIITDKGPFPFIEMNTSAQLKRGDWCLAIGHPGGFQKGRSPVVRVGRLLDVNVSYLRTDCTLVGGDSGGPLFDMTGKVIGIHSRIGGTITQNIHVPINTYRDTFDRLVKAEIWGNNIFGAGNEAYLGIEIGGGDVKGVKVGSVTPKSPAEKAGLKADDVITKFDGQAVANTDEFMKLLRRKSPGNEVAIEIRRGEETVQVRATIGKRAGG